MKTFNVIRYVLAIFLPFYDWDKKEYNCSSIRNAVEDCIEKSGFTLKEAFSSNLRKNYIR